MHNYELVLDGYGGFPTERVELRAHSPSVAITWGERSAHGRKFEIFEDGRSLGSATLFGGDNVWVLSPAKRMPDAPKPAIRRLRFGR